MGLILVGFRLAPHGDPAPFPVVGRPAPALTVTSLTGTAMTFPAAPTWVVFGAIWCPWCNREVPTLDKVAARLTGRLNVVAVEEGESARRVEEWRQGRRFSFAIALDPAGRTARRFGVEAYPTSYFLDRRGRLVAVHLGPFPSLRAIRPFLRRTLR